MSRRSDPRPADARFRPGDGGRPGRRRALRLPARRQRAAPIRRPDAHRPVPGGDSQRPVDADAGSGPTLAELFSSNGHLFNSQPRDCRRLWAGRPSPGGGQRAGSLDEHFRAPRASGVSRCLLLGPRCAVLARSLEPRGESLDHLRHELLIFLPLALVAASFGGYALAAGALRPVETLRRRAEAVTPGEAASCRCRPRETRSPGSPSR